MTIGLGVSTFLLIVNDDHAPFLSVFCPIFDFGGIFQGLDINFEFSTPKS